jgi:hypothetical protein
VLKSRCRLCAKQIDLKSPYCGQPKQPFSNEFRDIFNVDIEKDVTSVHPPKVCDAHVRFFTRYRELKKNGREMRTTQTTHKFIAHTETGCEVCEIPQKRPCPGRPRKPQMSSGSQPAQQILTSLHGAKEVSLIQDEVTELMKKVCSLGDSNRKAFLSDLCHNIDVSDRGLMAHELGSMQSDSLGREAASLEGKYMDISFLKNLTIGDYVSCMDPVTLNYIDGLCGAGETFMTAHVMEILYKMKRKRLVAPLSFLHNLDTYALTGSRQCLDRNSVGEPSGSYQTIVNWIDRQASKIPICPEGDIVYVFDNDQVIGKTYYIQPNSKVKSSVITNCAWIIIDEHGELQKRPDLMPRNWLNCPGFISKVTAVRESSTDLYSKLNEIHYQQTYLFIDAAIQQVMNEQSRNVEGHYIDVIDMDIERKSQEKPTSAEHNVREFGFDSSETYER